MNKCIVNKLIKEIEEIQKTDKWLNLRSIASNREVRNLEKENARLREKLKECDQLLKEIVEVVPQSEYNYYLNKIKQGKEE